MKAYTAKIEFVKLKPDEDITGMLSNDLTLYAATSDQKTQLKKKGLWVKQRKSNALLVENLRHADDVRNGWWVARFEIKKEPGKIELTEASAV